MQQRARHVAENPSAAKEMGSEGVRLDSRFEHSKSIHGSLGGAGTLELKSSLLELKNRIMSLSLGKKVAGSVLLIGVILTFALAGAGTRTENLQVVNGQQYLSNMYAETTNATIGYHNTQPTVWNLSGGSSPASAQVDSPAVVNFPDFSSPALLVPPHRLPDRLTVNVKEYPILYLQVQVTKGVGYGIRFFSSSDGNLVPLWNNSDILDHRIGTGAPENIQANIEDLALQNIGKTVTSISQVQIS